MEKALRLTEDVKVAPSEVREPEFLSWKLTMHQELTQSAPGSIKICRLWAGPKVRATSAG
jgi:hypothetical protein